MAEHEIEGKGPYQLRKLMAERGEQAPAKDDRKVGPTVVKARKGEAPKEAGGIVLRENGKVKHVAKHDDSARELAAGAERPLDSLTIQELQGLIPEGSEIKKGLRKGELVRALKNLGIEAG